MLPQNHHSDNRKPLVVPLVPFSRGRIMPVVSREADPQPCSRTTEPSEVLLLQFTWLLMPRVHFALELGLVPVPEQSCFAVQRRRTVQYHISSRITQSGKVSTYLFGSPSRLCMLNNTLSVLSAALHAPSFPAPAGFKMSRQMRPLMSTLG